MHPPTQVPTLAAKRFLYLGPWEDPKNFRLWLPAKNIAGHHVENMLPWTLEGLDRFGLDLFLSGDVIGHHVHEGWTFLALIGSRERAYYSCFFLADGEHSRESMALAAKERFPEVVGLYGLESLLCSPPAREGTELTTPG